MILKSFRIHNFQSIRDSNPVDVGDITCLVGKNEAGKTALLKALYRLNPITESDNIFNVTDDYPRSCVTEYEAAVKDGSHTPAVVTEATFGLDDDELKAIEAHFGPDVIPGAAFTLMRGYENMTCFSLHPDEKIAGMALLEGARLDGAFAQDNLEWESLAALAALLQTRAEEQAAAYGRATVAAQALTDPDEQNQALVAAQSLQEIAAEQALRDELAAIQKGGLAKHIYNTYLHPHVPKFLYFDDYNQMRGCENIEALQTRLASGQLLPSDYPLLGLVELASLKLAELVNPARTQELKNKLQGAGNFLTRKILKYWSQNKHLRLAFDVRPARPGDPEGMRSGTNIWAEVADQRHFVNTALGTRSRGFVWFFSFLAWYSRLQQTERQPLILLLDEPGLSLHGKAQEDLLRYFEEELLGKHQLLFSTHSPFMVDPTHFERVRIVQDRTIDSDEELAPDEEGTKVLADVLDAGRDSLFPLQGALGYEIYQGLFIGPNCLIVEGASDLLYLQSISATVSENGREGLSPSWTITPVGGADKVPTFVALIGAQKSLHVATLIDFQKTNAQMIENLYKRKLLSKNRVLTFADFTETAEADIEDMFESTFYLTLVNAAYKKELDHPLLLSNLKMHHPRILVSIEGYLGQAPLKAGAFNHYRPARYFAENAHSLGAELSAATLDRFEAAFKALNRLLDA